MKLFPFLTIILSCSMCCATTNGKGHKPAAPVHASPADMEFHRSVGQLVFKTPHGTLTATAWAVDSNLLMTAAHVCSGMQELAVAERQPAQFHMRVIGPNEEMIEGSGISVVYLDSMSDLCVLAAPGHPLKPLKIEENFDKVKRLSKVYMIGAPWGVFPVMKECSIASKTGHELNNKMLTERLITSCEPIPGFSGSPLISEDGKVVGAISGALILQDLLPAPGFVSYGARSTDILDILKIFH